LIFAKVIITFKKFISPQPVGGPSKRKKNPMCPLAKTALSKERGGER